jgi:hypothetical protein
MRVPNLLRVWGVAKLAAYCRCFAQQFAARAMLCLQNPGPPRPAKQIRDEERAMRTGCRQSLELPPLVFPAQP